MRTTLLLSALCVPVQAQAATFQFFDVPGAEGTCGVAIASTGLVAGTTTLSVAIVTAARSATPVVTPFLYAAGQLSYPHANLPANTIFSGVNRDRSVTATAYSFSITTPSSTSFIYHHGTVTTPSFGSLPVTALAGITDQGALLGQASVTQQLGGGFTLPYNFGFLRDPYGKITRIDDGSGALTPRGMDAKADKVVGYSFVAGPTGWLFAGSAFTPVNYPGASLTVPTGVDHAGTISGYYLLGSLTSGTAVGHGFFLRHGIYKNFDVPAKGVTSTYIQGMNEAEQITGCFTDATGTHGFIRTP